MTDVERIFPFAGRRRKQGEIYIPVPTEIAITLKVPCIIGYTGRRGVFLVSLVHDELCTVRHRSDATVFRQKTEMLFVLQQLTWYPRYTCLFVEPA